MCEAIYIGKNKHKSNKIINGHFSDLLRLIKNGQILDSFSAYLEQHFNSTKSHTDLRKCMTFKVLKQIKPIGAMKTLTKPN